METLFAQISAACIGHSIPAQDVCFITGVARGLLAGALLASLAACGGGVDFTLIAVLKERAIGFRRPAEKSELLRAGLHALAALDDAALRQALDGLAPVKSGRPRKT